MIRRTTSKQLLTLSECLEQEAARKRTQLKRRGPEREKFTRKALPAETATRVDEWSSSPGLQAPH
jgi:hypothetical protein